MSLKNHSLTQVHAAPVVSAVTLIMPSIEDMSEAELVELRHQIDLRLQLDLGQLNLSEELALQFRQAKALVNEVTQAKDTPVNQKAQLFNAVRSQLAEIVRQQESVWGIERLKKIEVATVKAAKLLTDEARAAFFDLYGEYLKETDAAPAAV